MGRTCTLEIEVADILIISFASFVCCMHFYFEVALAYARSFSEDTDFVVFDAGAKADLLCEVGAC